MYCGGFVSKDILLLTDYDDNLLDDFFSTPLLYASVERDEQINGSIYVFVLYWVRLHERFWQDFLLHSKSRQFKIITKKHYHRSSRR